MRNTLPVEIEEEPPHEIYASLIASSLAAANQSTAITRQASGGTTVRGRGQSNRHVVSSTHTLGSHEIHRENGQAIPTKPVVISSEDEDLPASFDSQFIRFYQKSIRDSKRRLRTQGLGGDGKDPANTSQTKNHLRFTNKKMKSHSALCHTCDNSFQIHAATTTKAERRRIARRERERQIAKDKQISIMLRSDVSDEYSLLYNQLHR